MTSEIESMLNETYKTYLASETVQDLAESVFLWLEKNAANSDDFFDAIAICLTNRFLDGRFKYDFCDWMVNSVEGYIVVTDGFRTGLYWEVYNAFDEGEYFHSGDSPWISPVEKYTRPALHAVVNKYPEAFKRSV
jgi:hypothetical protein